MITSLLDVHGKPTDEILEATLGGVIRQKGFAYNSTACTCVYRQKATGLRCAVGQIIGDDIFFPEANDDTNVVEYVDLIKAKTGKRELLTGFELELLTAIQSFHDEAAMDAYQSVGQLVFTELEVAHRLYKADVLGYNPEVVGVIRNWLARKIDELEAT